MTQRRNLSFPLASTLAGFIIAYAVSLTLYRGELHSAFDWAFTLSLLTIGFGTICFLLLPRAWKQFERVPKKIRYWGILLTVISAAFLSYHLNVISWVAFLFVAFLLASSGLVSFYELLDRKHFTRFVLSWMTGGLVSFFVLGFLKNFYPSLWEFVLLTVLLNTFFTIIFDFIIDHVKNSLRADFGTKVIPLAVIVLGFLFMLVAMDLLTQYPRLFNVEFFFPEIQWIPAFMGMAVLSQSWAALLLQKMDGYTWRTSHPAEWIKRNLPGLLLASILTIAAFVLAVAVVHPERAPVDNYFDTDSGFWLNFMTAAPDQLNNMRAVHPFAFLIFRPVAWFFSFLLHGNKFYAPLLLNSLFGGVCVFLIWSFFKRNNGNTTYALLVAALLGFSASHLILSVFLESYIFSAAALIAFVYLLRTKEKKLTKYVSVGLLTFGITITNFAQTCIAFLLTRRNIKTFLKYVLIVMALGVALAFVQDVLYPSSEPFYVPSSYAQESEYRFNIFQAESWNIIGRTNVLTRSIAMFSMMAPRPLILLKETNCSFPCILVYYYDRFGQYFISSYAGFGRLLAFVWLLLMLAAGILFVRNFIRSPKRFESMLSVALLSNIVFNFILHMNYGDDPMLYSPDWTYAIVFFFGLSFESLANKKWFQTILLIFLIGLAINNLGLFHKILDAILPFFP